MQAARDQCMVIALRTDEAGGRVGDQGGSHQRQDHGVIVRHLGDDYEGRDRRLHDTGEIGHHAEQHDGADRRVREQMRHIGADAGTDGERR